MTDFHVQSFYIWWHGSVVAPLLPFHFEPKKKRQKRENSNITLIQLGKLYKDQLDWKWISKWLAAAVASIKLLKIMPYGAVNCKKLSDKILNTFN